MKYLLFVFSVLLFSTSTSAQVKAEAIVGEWLTAAKDGKVEIYKTDDKFFGKITWGNKKGSKDTNNPDPKLRDQNLIGMVLLKNFVFNGKEKWEDGTIYDPNNGKTYSCVIRLKDSKTLEVRGYIGISLLGRTEVWTR